MAKMLYRVTSTVPSEPGAVLEIQASADNNEPGSVWTHRKAASYVARAARRGSPGTVHAIHRRREGSGTRWETVCTHTTLADGSVRYVNEIVERAEGGKGVVTQRGETPITPVRLTEDERDLALQLAAQVTGKEEIAAGLRVALHAEAKRRKLTPRTAEKKGSVKG